MEQQPLLRVHVRRLARRHAEKSGIELINRIQETAPARYRFAFPSGR